MTVGPLSFRNIRFLVIDKWGRFCITLLSGMLSIAVSTKEVCIAWS